MVYHYYRVRGPPKNLTITLDRGTPIYMPIYYTPYDGDPQEGCPSIFASQYIKVPYGALYSAYNFGFISPPQLAPRARGPHQEPRKVPASLYFQKRSPNLRKLLHTLPPCHAPNPGVTPQKRPTNPCKP